MARNGSGTFTVVNTFSALTTITASGFNTNFSDIGAEMTNSVAADGQTTITGALKGASGTFGAPGYAFSADLDCGMYRIGANNIGISVAGAKVLDISATGLSVVGALSMSGQVSAPNGTVGAPGHSFTNELDCGAYVIGTNNIGYAVAGAKVLDVSTTGLGITGTTVSSGGITATTGGLTATAGGLTVTAGSVSLPAGSVANAALAVPNAFVLIQTQVASTSATIDFETGLNDTNYDEFMLVISSLKPATDDQDVWLRIGTGSGPVSYIATGTYGWANTCRFANAANSAPKSSSLTDTKLVLTAANGTLGVGNASGEYYSGVIYFSNPEASDFVEFMWSGRYGAALPDAGTSDGGGRYNVAGAITGVRVMFGSGNIASGRLSLYGLKKA